MSLLLEALKKAEKAKEEAQRRADAGSESERTELSLQEEATPAAEKKPLITRDKLPDISSPLEIVSDDLAPAAAVPEPEPAPAPSPRRRAAASPASAADPQAGERAAARKVFEAKFKEPNPRLPFYITMGGLGVFAVGTVIYFYLQLRPPPPLVNANPPRTGSEQPVPTVADAKPAAAPSASPGEAPIPGLPGAPAVRTAPAAALPAAASAAAPRAPAPAATAPRAAAAPETPRLRPQPARVQPSEPARETPPPSREPQVHPRVESGYAAFLAGDGAAARREYQQALDTDPSNRDALLGMAALDVRAGRHELAEATYLRLLASDPRDTSAHAALLALRTGRMDPLVAESRLKSMLAAEPGAHALNFALGNQFAQQGRWAEAQQEYFKAAAAEPDNPDFAYNLAVSLDQLRQPRAALEHYRRAIALAEKRGASFDIAAARTRAAQLGK
jgi:tetratricopeptide (TPR) repeat protein